MIITLYLDIHYMSTTLFRHSIGVLTGGNPEIIAQYWLYYLVQLVLIHFQFYANFDDMPTKLTCSKIRKSMVFDLLVARCQRIVLSAIEPCDPTIVWWGSSNSWWITSINYLSNQSTLPWLYYSSSTRTEVRQGWNLANYTIVRVELGYVLNHFDCYVRYDLESVIFNVTSTLLFSPKLSCGKKQRVCAQYAIAS